ncbi:hypothetical protein LXL04_036839 [Taraxacum kok-saghyz]
MAMDIPVKRYRLVREGNVVFMTVISPSRVTFELTSVKCNNANTVEVNWRGGADRFKKTTTCGGVGCHESLAMWEIFHGRYSIIAIKGHFTIKERIVDTRITWRGKFHDNVLDFHTTGDGNGSIPEVEARFNRLVENELNRIRVEYIVGNSPEDSSGSDYSSEISSEDEEDVDEGDDAGGAIKDLFKNMKYNYRIENSEDIAPEKMRRKERKERRKEGLALQDDVREAMPFPFGLAFVVQEISKRIRS